MSHERVLGFQGDRRRKRNRIPCTIIPLIFLFIFYVTTALFALLAYILWYMLCTNITLAFIITRQC